MLVLGYVARQKNDNTEKEIEQLHHITRAVMKKQSFSATHIQTSKRKISK